MEQPTDYADPPAHTAPIKMRQLELMLAIDRAGNLRKAAALMKLTQPAASRILQDMEAALEAKLFERSHEGLIATVFGRDVLIRARAVMADIDAIAESVSALRAGDAGILRLGTTSSFAPTLLATAIAQIKRASPKLRIEVVEADNEKLLQELRSGELDLVVGRTMSGELADDLWRETVYKEQFHVVCDVSHPLADRKDLRGAELIQWPWIMPPTSAPLRHMLETQFALTGVMPPSNTLISTSAMTNLALLRAMPCLAVMSNGLATSLAAEGRLRILQCGIKLSSGAGCAYFRRRDDALSGPTAQLLKSMRANVPAL